MILGSKCSSSRVSSRKVVGFGMRLNWDLAIIEMKWEHETEKLQSILEKQMGNAKLSETSIVLRFLIL